MTREEAIEFFKDMNECTYGDVEPIQMAIKALEQENVLFKSGLLKDCESCRAEQEPCEDTISRQAMLEYQHCLYGKMSNRENHKLWKFITDLPSVTPTRKVGKWIKNNIGGAKVCSVCNAHMGLSVFKFCPNCGAEMEGEE